MVVIWWNIKIISKGIKTFASHHQIFSYCLKALINTLIFSSFLIYSMNVNKCVFGAHLIKLPVSVSVYDTKWSNFQQCSECWQLSVSPLLKLFIASELWFHQVWEMEIHSRSSISWEAVQQRQIKLYINTMTYWERFVDRQTGIQRTTCSPHIYKAKSNECPWIQFMISMHTSYLIVFPTNVIVFPVILSGQR